MNPRHAIGFVGLFLLVLLVALVQLLFTGCAYQRYDTITNVELPTGGTFSLPKGGALVRVEVKDNAGTVEKSTPFDFLRGLGQGSAVSAAPGGSATQSGTLLDTAGSATPTTPQSAIRNPQSLTPSEILQSMGATSLPSTAGSATRILPADAGGLDKTIGELTE